MKLTRHLWGPLLMGNARLLVNFLLDKYNTHLIVISIV
jgi:hypothetical protein